MLCQKCYGSGTIMGQGLMYEDCRCQYEDTEKISRESIQIDKRSKAYRDAISKIMQENEITRDEATELFEQEFYKIA